MSEPNPYTWNRVSLDVFYGRDRLVNELSDALPASQALSFALAGGRRMGKTTVLRVLERELRAAQAAWRSQQVLVIPIYLDGLSLPRPLTAESIWGEIHNQVLSATTAGVCEGGLLSFTEFVTRVRSLIETNPEAVKVVVLFDEIEPILLNDWSDGFFANWRALLSNIPGVSSSFSAVFAGARELVRLRHDVGSPLMDILEFRSLRNLSFGDCRRLLCEPAQRDWGNAFCEFVYAQTGGHPMLTQYIMHSVFSASNFDAALECGASAVSQFLNTRAWQFSDLWYKGCTTSSQQVYSRLPSDGSAIPLSALTTEFGMRNCTEALEILQHVGIVAVDEVALVVRRLGMMFSDWQKVHGPAVQGAAHDLRIYGMLQLLDSTLATKYASAWGILASEQQNYSGAVSEIRDTVTLVLNSLAPDADVLRMPGFSLEAGQERPTRRQRARFIVVQKHKPSGSLKAVTDDVALLEAYVDRFASFVSSTYALASGLTHTTSTYELAYQALKQADSVLAQLLG